MPIDCAGDERSLRCEVESELRPCGFGPESSALMR